ncbi:hypothetical protein PIB30_068712 [Stylosanthes scabra]|uniref:Uncharacterized protein n=1 Tax=Stylosanthes scabra TaxID=79078 RepID=A0ABU6VPU1_9FABA|nr:hypothetical protein [Stylosanthes scabra]
MTPSSSLCLLPISLEAKFDLDSAGVHHLVLAIIGGLELEPSEVTVLPPRLLSLVLELHSLNLLTAIKTRGSEQFEVPTMATSAQGPRRTLMPLSQSVRAANGRLNLRSTPRPSR